MTSPATVAPVASNVHTFTDYQYVLNFIALLAGRKTNFSLEVKNGVYTFYVED